MNGKRALLRVALAAATLAGATTLAACGSEGTQAKAADGTVTLTSLPSAQVFVDGQVKGTTPLTLALSAGEHKLVLKADGFADESQSLVVKGGAPASIEVNLAANDPEDPRVIAALARGIGFEVAPAEEILVHRGSAKEALAVILWPQGDVRKSGLTTFRIDVSDAYSDDGVLRFKLGKKVLYERDFKPEQLISWEPLPAEVIATVGKGDKVTWGLFFDGARAPKDVTAVFEVVERPQADEALKKIDTNKAYLRQDPLSRELLKGEALQNYRLYTEAMAKYIEILVADPETWLPFRGMVASLRRMGAEESSLYVELSQFVSGKGQAKTGGPTGLGQVPNGLRQGLDKKLIAHNEAVAGRPKSALGPHGSVPAKSTPAGPAGTGGLGGGEESAEDAAKKALDELFHRALEAQARASQAQQDARNALSAFNQMKMAHQLAEQFKAKAMDLAQQQAAAAAALDALVAGGAVPGDPAYDAAQEKLTYLTKIAKEAAQAYQAASQNLPSPGEMLAAEEAAKAAQEHADQLAAGAAAIRAQLQAAGVTMPVGDPTQPPTPYDPVAPTPPPGGGPTPVGGGGPATAGGPVPAGGGPVPVGPGPFGPLGPETPHMTPAQWTAKLTEAQNRVAQTTAAVDAARSQMNHAEQLYQFAVATSAPDLIEKKKAFEEAAQNLAKAQELASKAQQQLDFITKKMQEEHH
jgi:hypothetical protein